MGGIGVVTNPRSRLNRRNPRLARQLAYILGEKGTIEQPTDLEALRRTAEGFRQHGIGLVSVGAVHLRVHAVIEPDPRGIPLEAVHLASGHDLAGAVVVNGGITCAQRRCLLAQAIEAGVLQGNQIAHQLFGQ